MPDALSPDFRVLFEKYPGLSLVLDPHFFIIAATDDYLRATMTQREDIVGQHLFDVFSGSPGDARAATIRNLRSSLERILRDRVADAMGVQRYDIRLPSGELQERYWSPINTPVLDLHNRVKYIIHCVEDVSDFVRRIRSHHPAVDLADLRPERIGMETEILLRSQELGNTNEELKVANEELALRTAQLHDALQAMETFTYSIAHDLRAPLRAMVMFSSMVVEEHGGDLQDQGKDYLNRIRDAARRMDRLVSDLLVYGRLTHVEATSMPISLENAVNKVIEDLHGEIQSRQADIEVQRPLPVIMGNPILLNHVLVNLIDNATKFMPAGRPPRVSIRCSPVREERVRLSISDNGIGIAPEYHTKIFDLFARLHKPSEYSGTGIGLALVKRAMDRMLGKVGVESTIGQGSSFWLEFREAR
jgi:signal transduction histidine kinase